MAVQGRGCSSECHIVIFSTYIYAVLASEAKKAPIPGKCAACRCVDRGWQKAQQSSNNNSFLLCKGRRMHLLFVNVKLQPAEGRVLCTQMPFLLCFICCFPFSRRRSKKKSSSWRIWRRWLQGAAAVTCAVSLAPSEIKIVMRWHNITIK